MRNPGADQAEEKFCLVEFPVFSDYIIHAEKVESFEEAIQRYKIRGMNDWDARADAVTIKRHGKNMSMIFFKGRVALGTIAHEAFHAVQQMMDWSGCKYDEETTAYHLGYTVNCICSFLRKGRKPRNGKVRTK